MPILLQNYHEKVPEIQIWKIRFQPSLGSVQPEKYDHRSNIPHNGLRILPKKAHSWDKVPKQNPQRLFVQHFKQVVLVRW